LPLERVFIQVLRKKPLSGPAFGIHLLWFRCRAKRAAEKLGNPGEIGGKPPSGDKWLG
jgi:hypothetical protein